MWVKILIEDLLWCAREWSKRCRVNIKKLFRKQAAACPAGTLRSNDTKQNENQKQS